MGKGFGVCSIVALLAVGWLSATDLTPKTPILAEVRAGERVTFRLPCPSGQRGIVTLTPLDGDADLFLLPSLETPLERATQKSAGIALQAERLVLSALKEPTEKWVAVKGVTPTRFLLTVQWTKRQIRQQPSQTKVIAVQWQDIQFSDAVALGAVTVGNRTPIWYEVQVRASGMEKAPQGASFLLGPNGTRYLGWVALPTGGRLTVTAQRTQKADIVFVVDLICRLVAGNALAPDLTVAVDDLLPHLTPLLPVAEAVRKGDWRQASAKLAAAIRKSPQTLRTLHAFLQRAGGSLSLPLLGSRLNAGFGALSATIAAIAAANSPSQESVTLAWQ
ncbi:MAG: hypothetical protein LKKZDAJK_001194 [Candidatus Fervidibacter sp.]